MSITLTNVLAIDLDSLIEMDNYCLLFTNVKLANPLAYYCESTFHRSPPPWKKRKKSMFIYLILLFSFSFTMHRLAVCSRLATQKTEPEDFILTFSFNCVKVVFVTCLLVCFVRLKSDSSIM